MGCLHRCDQTLWDVGRHNAHTKHYYRLHLTLYHFGHTDRDCYGAIQSVQSVVTPLLDVMTMPAFVYLIPVVMLLGIGKIPGLIAVVIYAIPPVIRLTNLGIRLVDKEVLKQQRPLALAQSRG